MENNCLHKGWEKTKFGNIFTERTERSSIGNLLSVTSNRGIIPQTDSTKRDTSSKDKSNYKKVEIGDIVYNTMRLWQGVASRSAYNGIVSPAYTVCKPTEKIDSKFAAYIFKKPSYVALFHQFSQGLVDDTLNLKFTTFSNLSVSIPSLYEQQRIAEILDTADEAIRKTEQIIAKLKQAKGGILYDLLFSKHQHSKNYSIVDLAEINPACDYTKLTRNSVVSFIPMGDITDTGLWINKKTQPLNVVRKGYTPFKDQDVLFAKITPCMENGKGGFVENLVNGMGFGSTEFHVLRHKPQIHPKYLYYITQSIQFRKEAEVFMIGSAGQQRVQPEFFSAFTIGLPELEEQNKMVQIFDVYNEKIQKEENYLAKLKQLKQGLIEDLLTGKVRTVTSVNENS